MVIDFEEGQILGEINDLDEEIEALEALEPLAFAVSHKRVKIVRRTLARLKKEKEHQIMRLRIHRERAAESGIKY